MQISRHFSRKEFTCRCGKCGFNTVDAELISVLEDVRHYFKKPVKINSGARCTAHNMDEGGTPTSQHLLGRAADIVVESVLPSRVYEYINSKYPNEYGLGCYAEFTHIDTRSNKARW